jgi:hypothetical protein
LARELLGRAEVVLLENGEATWALSEHLPPRLDVYGGAARIWWPGLCPGSHPYEHRLYLVHGPDDARLVQGRLIEAVRGSVGTAPGGTARQGAPRERVTVTAVAAGRIAVASGGRTGLIVDADLPLDLIAGCLVAGMELEAQLVRTLEDGGGAYSLAGLLPNAWERLVDDVRPGDVLVGRVQNVVEAKGLVFVDVLPGAVGICPARELDLAPVGDIGEHVRIGELLPFEIVAIDAEGMGLQLSRRRAFGAAPRPSPSLAPGGRPFVWDVSMPMFESLRRKARDGGGATRVRVLERPASSAAAGEPDRQDLDEQVTALTDELAAARADRADLVDQIRELRVQVQQQKKDLRAAADRYDGLARKTAGELDPLASERAFLLAIRLCHARMFEEHDRLAYPLRKMRVGGSFLRSVRELDGVAVDKVVEVCTQVASGIAHTLPAREVHQLREGSRGSGARTRQSDEAKAWRCSLQDQTSSARRLHWWSSGAGGGVIEFASVSVHDEYSIPE